MLLWPPLLRNLRPERPLLGVPWQGLNSRQFLPLGLEEPRIAKFSYSVPFCLYRLSDQGQAVTATLWPAAVKPQLVAPQFWTAFWVETAQTEWGLPRDPGCSVGRHFPGSSLTQPPWTSWRRSSGIPVGLFMNPNSCLWPSKSSAPTSFSHPCPSCDFLLPTCPSPKTMELGIKIYIAISQFSLGFNPTPQFAGWHWRNHFPFLRVSFLLCVK